MSKNNSFHPFSSVISEFFKSDTDSISVLNRNNSMPAKPFRSDLFPTTTTKEKILMSVTRDHFHLDYDNGHSLDCVVDIDLQ